ncbi:MAG TPA: glycosyltransferase [Candidatus Saccharimonadales bacterium]
MTALGVYFIIYGILAISHILTQMYIGHMEHRRQKAKHFTQWRQGHFPSVSVIVPAYNEEPEILRACITSLAEQNYESLEVLVVDDGSTKRDELKRDVYDTFADDPRVHIIYTPINVGKRHAQKFGFNRSTGQIIVTVDSDTIVPTNGIREIVQRFKDPSIGAVTGDVQVENSKTNLLTTLIGFRYWSAFHQERAAQSYFYVLMCCSGPFSAYRKSVIDHVKDRYTSQNFMGKRCTFGDDRHLTNLVLEEGYRVVFDNKAIAYTHVPENIHRYIKQQVRWNKSFYREMLWTLKSWRKHHAYMLYDLIMQLVLPFLLIVALGGMAYQSFIYGPHVVLWYLGTIVVIALLRASYGIIRTNNPGFLLFVLYGFIHLFLLMPTRLYALFTINETKWGTR